jgi:hypothetical protein
MINGWRCYEAMNELEKRRWWKNAKGNCTVLLNDKWDDFAQFISASFVWEHTKEGQDYWREIAEKYKLHDTLSPHKKFGYRSPRKPFT